MIRNPLPVLLFLAVLTPGAFGLPVTSLSDQAEISVLTMGPGKEIYLAFGHSAFRVTDPIRGIDWVFNYGTFNLEDPLFIPKFVRGELNYSLSIADFSRYLDWDKSNQNRVWINQKLNLGQEQKNALFQYLANNYQEKNRYYLYDIIYDNCSTRITKALVETFPHQIVFDPQSLPLKTYRQRLDDYASLRPGFQFLFYLAVGSVTDHLEKFEKSDWLPFNLLALMEGAKIERDGILVPLVEAKTTLYAPPTPIVYESPWSDPGFILWPLGLLVVVVTGFQVKKYLKAPEIGHKKFLKRNPWGDFTLIFLVGFLGGVLFYLEVFSIHSLSKSNLNLVWFWPTHMVAAFLVLTKSPPRWLGWYLLAAGAAAIVPLLFRPIWPQSQLLSIIPVQLMVAARMGWYFLVSRSPYCRTSV